MKDQASEELENEKRLQLDEARKEARKIIATAQKTADIRVRKALEDAHDEIRALAVGMVEKMVMESSGEAMDRFLSETEKESGNA